MIIRKPTLKQLAARGFSQRQIARHFGCTHGAVSMACRCLAMWGLLSWKRAES